MDIIKSYSGLIALVILAIMGLSGVLKEKSNLVGSTSCGSITCLAGGLRLVSDLGGAFEVDIASTISAALNVTGLLSTSAGITNIQTGTSTLKLKSTSTTKGFCIEVNATSSNTVMNLTATSSTSGSSGSSGLLLSYGACT